MHTVDVTVKTVEGTLMVRVEVEEVVSVRVDP